MDRLGTLDSVAPRRPARPRRRRSSTAHCRRWGGDRAAGVLVAATTELADTAEFCAAYDVPLDVSANGRCWPPGGRGPASSPPAWCAATTRADVNRSGPAQAEARKASFAPMDVAVAESGMDYGGITPVGLPPGWPLLVDRAVVETDPVIVGSGVRSSKLALAGHWPRRPARRRGRGRLGPRRSLTCEGASVGRSVVVTTRRPTVTVATGASGPMAPEPGPPRFVRWRLNVPMPSRRSPRWPTPVPCSRWS